DAERNRARSRELAAHAQTTMNEDPELAIALGLRGMQYADTADARSALIEASRYAWPYADLSPSDVGGNPRVVALSADGSRLVVLAGANAISVWDVTLRQPSRLWPKDTTSTAETAKAADPAASVAFSPDSKVIAVGRSTAVDLLDATTGAPVSSLLQLSNNVANRRIVFSPDGRWLASSQANPTELLLVEYATPGAQPVTIVAPPSHDIGGFAVLRDGKAIVTVGGRPLDAYLFERDKGWAARKLDVTPCFARASVSPGGEYVSATWRMNACSTAIDGRQPSIPTDSEDGVADDIVWSPGGVGFVEFLRTSQKTFDLVVGRQNQSGPLASRIKGTHPITASEKSRFVSTSEAGTRAALIDLDEDHKRVRICSLASYKPFLSRFEGAFTVSPDGRWIAFARPEAGNGGQRAAIDVLPLEKAFTRNRAFYGGASISVERLPRQLHASSDSLVAVVDGAAPQTAVFDVRTHEPRYEPLSGIWQPLDAAGEVLLVHPRRAAPRILRTPDAVPIAGVEAAAAGMLLGVRGSPTGGA